MSDPLAHLGAVPGNAADEDAAVVPSAPVQTYLRKSSEIAAAVHAGDIEFFEEPLGWQQWSANWHRVNANDQKSPQHRIKVP